MSGQRDEGRRTDEKLTRLDDAVSTERRQRILFFRNIIFLKLASITRGAMFLLKLHGLSMISE